MKKVININFQGRVIPIEETAFELLKQYVESLRHYFINEEGRDEIINDIENRIAELCEEKLRKGAVCITDEDINTVITSMGRPEDFEQEDITYYSRKKDSFGNAGEGSTAKSASSDSVNESRRLHRAENDKVLGGVCAGIGYYLKIDPILVRIIYAFIALGSFGFGFLLYILLWILLPSQPLQTKIRKRLYRDYENKMIGGVAAGIGAYFNIEVWIPRLIFLLPLVFSVGSNLFRGFWWHWGGPWIAFGGLGGTFFIIYVILWIVLPRAVTASEKLEMRGEKVDLESIKNTVQEELQNIKSQGEKIGAELKEKSKVLGKEIKDTLQQKTQRFATEAGPIAHRAGNGIGNAIGILFKAFFLFIAGIIVFALFVALIAILFAGMSVFPLKSFLLDGIWQTLLVWMVLILFMGIPIVALMVWLVRRMINAKSRNRYIGYAFGSLWMIGLISCFVLAGMVSRNFKTRAGVEEPIHIIQPSSGNMIVQVSQDKIPYYNRDWFSDDLPFLYMNEDSMLLNTVRVKLLKSADSAYHIQLVKLAAGNTSAIAEQNAGHIRFPVIQNDSLILLPKGFPITKNNPFRNQQVMVIIEVPVGKRIFIDKSASWFEWFEITMSNRRKWNFDWEERWDNGYSWRYNVPYIMTTNGLERMDKRTNQEMENKEAEYKLQTYHSKKPVNPLIAYLNTLPGRN